MNKIMIYTKHKPFNYKNLIEVAGKNSNYILLFSILISGIILGCSFVFTTDSEASIKFSELLNCFFTTKSAFLNCFLTQLTMNSVFLLFAFTAGLCSIGIPLICCLPLVEGFFVGICSGFYLSEGVMAGLSTFLLQAAPGLIIFTTVSTVAYNTALKMSADLAATVFINGKSRKNSVDYLIKFTIYFLIGGVAALISAATLSL